MAPDRPSAVQIDGEAGVFQVFVDRSVHDHAADHRFDCESALGINDRDLLGCHRQAVHERQTRRPGRRSLETDRPLAPGRATAGERQSSCDGKVSRGGMSSSAMRRVDEVITEQFCATDSRAPSVDELAAAARMSASHFIRAFRRSTGATPH